MKKKKRRKRKIEGDIAEKETLVYCLNEHPPFTSLSVHPTTCLSLELFTVSLSSKTKHSTNPVYFFFAGSLLVPILLADKRQVRTYSKILDFTCVRTMIVGVSSGVSNYPRQDASFVFIFAACYKRALA